MEFSEFVYNKQISRFEQQHLMKLEELKNTLTINEFIKFLYKLYDSGFIDGYNEKDASFADAVIYAFHL